MFLMVRNPEIMNFLEELDPDSDLRPGLSKWVYSR
jgi:hypothetical protein